MAKTTTKPKSKAKMSASDRVKGIEAEIEGTRKRIDTIDRKVEHMNKSLVVVLSEQHTEEDVRAIENAQAALEIERSALTKRVTAMEMGLPAARAAIDKEALALSLEGYDAVLEESNQSVIAWRELIASLPALGEAAKDVRNSTWGLRELSDKIRYLEYLTDTPRSELTPGETIAEKELSQAEALFREALNVYRFPPLSFKETRWRRELETLRTSRHRAEAKRRDREEYEKQRAGVQVIV